MGGACSTHGSDANYKILVENLKRRDLAEDLGVDGRKTLEWMLGK